MNTLEKIITILQQDGKLPEAPAKADKYGFYGERTPFGGVHNTIVDSIVNSWLQSPDKANRQAAELAPKYFVFFTDQEQHDAMSEEMQLLYNKNHNKRLSVRNIIYRYEDENNKPVAEHAIISLGNNNYPKTREKDFHLKMEYFINRWLWKKSEEIKGGGLNLG